MTRTCPSCHKPATGRFCSDCGAAVDAECRECGNALPPGARFCNQCGATAGGAAGADAPAGERRAAMVPWAVAGVAVLALAAVLAWALLRGDDPAAAPTAATAPLGGISGSTPPAGTAPAPAGNPAAVDLQNMSPREAADRLFNRVMTNVSGGDTAQARAFLPMAIAAYGRVGDLDDDGRYHLAVLHLVGNDPQSARAEANAILSNDPQHLFGLFTAAQAEQALGNQTRARELYRRFLDNSETERTRDRPEYRDHAQALTPMRDEAQRAVGGS